MNRVVRRILTLPASRILIASVALATGTWVWGSWFRADTALPPVLPPQVVADLASMRQSAMTADAPVLVDRDVQYPATPDAVWYPRGESPVLTDLVRTRQLPPVAERTGLEPLVLRGVDGIGQYGGIWSDAVTWSSQVWDRMNRYNAGVTLARWSPAGYPIVPHVAKGWETSPDHRVWTFHLRRGMRWSDGHPFTAADFTYWYEWEMLYFQRRGYALNDEGYRLLQNGASYGLVEQVDDHTVRFVFEEPNPFFLELIAGTSVKELFAPKHYLAKYHPELGDRPLIEEIMRRRGFSEAHQVYLEVKREDNPEHPRINPWIYRRYSPHPPHAFVRNPYYWAVDAAGNQLPYIDQITEEVITPELLALKTASGGYPALFETADLKLSNYGLYMAGARQYRYDVRHYGSGQSSLWSITPNQNLYVAPGDERGRQKATLLQSRGFRQALSLAINRRAIIRAEFFGFGEPAQVAPAPTSPFHSERLYRAFTDYDPSRAQALLDELGLTQRDADGYRTLPDGSPMVWFILYPENTAPETFQFVLDDWAAVGIRAIARPVPEGVKVAERMANTYEFYAHPSYFDFVPVVDPKSFVPVDRWSTFAPVYGRWYESRLLAGHDEAVVRAVPPPPDSVFAQAQNLYDQAMTASSKEQGIRQFRQLLDLIADEVWSISIASAPPAIAVVRDDLRNVPLHGITGNVFHSPLNLGPESFYFENPTMSPGALTRLREDLIAPGFSPLLVTGEAAREQDAGDNIGRLLRWILGGIVAAGLGLLALRHPFVGRRLLLFVPMLLLISVMSFVIIQAPPGDVIETQLLALEETGTRVSQEEIARIRSQFHLDKSMVERYLRWTGLYWFTTFNEKDQGLLQGDLDLSMIDPRRPQAVNDLVGDRLLFTVVLSVGTILFTWSLALPIGIYSAVKQYSPADYALTFLGFIGMSVPGFLLSLLMMYWGGRFLGLDLTGLFSPAYQAQPEWTWGKVVDLLQHIWVPLIVLGVEGTAQMIRIMRANLLDELRKPYVQTARAKGLRPVRMILKYPVRVALNPFVSSIGALFPELISGGAIVSVVLGLPTIGPLLLSALLNEDVYLAGSMLVVLSLLGILGTLVSDLLLTALDPRIRMEGRV